MVKVPEYTQNVSLRPAFRQGIDIPQATPEAFGADIGKGMQKFAAGMGDAATAAYHVQALEDETMAREARNNFIRDKDQLLYGDGKEQGGYATQEGRAAIDGFEGYRSNLDDLKRRYGTGLTPKAAELFNKAVEPLEIDATRTALIHKSKALKSFAVDQATNGVANFKTQAVQSYGDAAQWQKYTGAGLAELDGLADKLGWAPEKRTAERQAFLSDTHRLTALEMANADPIAALEYVTTNRAEFSPVDHLNVMGALARAVAPAVTQDALAHDRANPVSATDALVGKIITAESGGRADLKNPKSSASGVGQFLDSTWLATIKKNRPDIAEGKSDQAILALKSDPELGREMTRRYAEENAATLSAAGIQATPGNVYAAHFLGPGGAKTVLSASDNAQLADLLPAAVLTANPFLAGKDVSWFRQWTAGKMVGAAADSVKFSPRVENLLAALPENYAGRIREAAAGGIVKADVAEAAQVKAARATLVDNFNLRISKEDQTLSRDEILKDAVLDEGDKAKLLNSYTTKFNDALATRQALASFQAGQGLAVDPYSSTGRKTVDNVWGAIATSVPKEQLTATLDEIVSSSGVVPQAVLHSIRSDLTSRGANAVAGAATLAARLYTIDPAAFDRREGGKEVRDAAVTFSHLTKNVGLTPLQAGQRMVEASDPAKAQERAALMKSDPVKKFIKDQATEGNVRDVFDKGFFGGVDPVLGSTPLQSAAMVGEYRDILEESLYDTAGKQDTAKALAADRFKRRYGASEFTLGGTGQVTRLPPEITYRPGLDGSHAYVTDQLKAALKSEGVAAKEIYLQTSAQTEQDFNAGRPARYEVWFKNSDGVLDRFRLPFYAVAPTKEEISAARKAKAERNRDTNMSRKELETDQIMRGSPNTVYPTGAF